MEDDFNSSYGDPAEIDTQFYEWMQLTVAFSLRRAGKIPEPCTDVMIKEASQTELNGIVERLFGNRSRKHKIALGELMEAVLRHCYEIVMDSYE